MSFTFNIGEMGISRSATANENGTVTGFSGLTAGTTYMVVLETSAYKLTCTDVVYADKVIRTKEDLNAVRYNGTNITGYYALANDIMDYGAVTSLNSPAWDASKGFLGTFDGRGHKIDGLDFTNSKNGFFGSIGTGACVKDFTFDNVIAESGYERTILAKYCLGNPDKIVVSDVTIRFKELKATATSQQDASSMLIGRSTQGTKFVNVTLDASGLDIPQYLYVLSHQVQSSSTFENCTVKANSYVEVTRDSSTLPSGVTFVQTTSGEEE